MEGLVAGRLRGGLFKQTTHKPSGIASWLLRNGAAREQMSLYFTGACCDHDFRLLWFCWSRPWAGTAAAGRMLGLADLEAGALRHFADHPFSDGGLAALPDSGEAIWCSGPDVWQRGPDPATRPRRLGGLPHAMVHRRQLRRLATQPTRSADGTRMLLDSQIGARCYLGTLEIATGGYEVVFCGTQPFNHAQFSPTDPCLALVVREDEVDPTTGASTPYDHRIFLWHGEQGLMPFGPPGRQVGHETWAADGQAIWAVDFRRGVLRLPLSGPPELVWPGFGWHAHASACGRYVVADHRLSERRGGPAWVVAFLNRVTGRSVEIARMPIPEEDRLHRHPHPRFGARDRVITYTSMIRGVADVAVVDVAELLAATA
jgi:hypothetical protein